MQRFEGTPAAPERPHAFGVWLACAAVLLGPSLLVWMVRLAALAMTCAPGPELCRGTTLGGGFRDTLELAWAVGTNLYLNIAVAFIAAVAALRLRRPAMAGLSLLVLPLAALVLPTLAVFTAMYPGCDANEAGVGDCRLWGAGMGMSFHHAAMAPWIIYGLVPYGFALALMIGAVGFLFFRPHSAAGQPPARHFDRSAKAFHDRRD